MDQLEKNRRKKDLLEAFQFRHAAKSFNKEKLISQEDFDFILEAARLSPSSFGFEPWSLIILQDKELREKLKSVSWGAQGQLPTASHFVLIVVRKSKDLTPQSSYIKHMMSDVKELPADRQEGMRDRYNNFLKEDFQINSDEQFREWASRQAYIALGNMMTAAAFIGIDSCAIEGFNREKADEVLQNSGIIDTNVFTLSCFAAFGYRENEPRKKTRRDLEETVLWK